MSSRTLLWYSCLTGLAAAGLLYVASDYARKHPDSLTGRCFRSACMVCTECSPVCAGGKAASIASQAFTEGTQEACEACEAGEPGTPVVDPAPPEPSQVIDISVCQERPEVECSDGDQRCPASPCRGYSPCQPQCPSEPVTVPPSAIEETDPSVPATMPEATDGPEEITVMPTMEVEPTQPDAGAQEENETGEGQSPPCQMSPHHGHEYPGCPYMGGCRPSPCPTPVAPIEVKKLKKKKKVTPTEPEEAPMPKLIKKDIVVPVPYDISADEEEEMPQRHDIDTMEFRKSDAKKGEFRKRPL